MNKECMKQWHIDNKERELEYRLVNKERLKEYSKQYYINNKEGIDKYYRQYCIDNKKELERKRQWNKDNLEYHKQYRENNKEKIKESTKRWREKNPEYCSQYHIKNREEILERHKQYNQTEIGKATMQRKDSKRRAILKNIINTLTAQEWLDILEAYNYRCAYCDVEFEIENMPTKDHVIPLTKGGHNTKENIIPACHSCNSKKYNKIL